MMLPTTKLSSKQADVLYYASVGKSQADVAEILGISKKTVETHHKRIKEKLNTCNQTHSVAVAIRAGLIGRPE